jgi:hypothetical protein
VTVDDLLPRLQGVRQSGDHWYAKCPAHDDQQASLSITLGDKGILLKDHAGCELAAICTAVQCEPKDLFFDTIAPARETKPRRRLVATYDYRDEAGEVVHQVLRYEPKGFSQRRRGPDGEWVNNLNGCRKLLYRYPELIAAPKNRAVLLVEGEKDADRLAALGFVVTTTVGGAGAKWDPAWTHHFDGRHIIPLPDNDEPGRKHMLDLARACRLNAASIRILEIPGLPPKGDVSDWLDAGHTADELKELIGATPLWKPTEADREPPPEKKPAPIVASTPGIVPGSSLVDLDVVGLLEKGGWEPKPVLDDFLWDKTFTYLSGSSGSFKTWLMLSWAVAMVSQKPFIRQQTYGEQRILFVECESNVQILQRLPKLCAAYGVTLNDTLEALRFVVPDGRALRLEDEKQAAHVMALANEHAATWVFIDSLRRVTSLNENHAEDMSTLADSAFLPLRNAGHNVLLLEHPAKPMAGVVRSRKESMRGSGEKSAAADVVLNVESLETDGGRVASLSTGKCRLAPERDEPLYMRLRDSSQGNVTSTEFEEVEEPAGQFIKPRKTNRLDQARNIIGNEKVRKPDLTYAEAIKYCVAAGLSSSTAKRAWNEAK